MRIRPTLLFVISFLALGRLQAQDIDAGENAPDNTQIEAQDSLPPVKTVERYGLRLGLDLGKIVRTALDDNYQGLELMGDFRIKDNYYLAAEIGNETRDSEENTFNAITKGSYIKAGFNYNAYNNWAGMSNLIYVGVRAGFSTFSSELEDYTIYTTNTFYGPDFREENREFSGLSGSWVEIQLGVQAELFKNVYLGFNVQLKGLITQTEPEDFGNLYIPGFNKVTTDNGFGAGYGYTLTYFIPFYKK